MIEFNIDGIEYKIGNITVGDSYKIEQYLITDDYASTSGKMKAAEKKGIKIKRYDDFKKENSVSIKVSKYFRFVNN